MSLLATAPLELDRVEYPGVKRLLYPHQAEVLDRWKEASALVVGTGTGTGKTAAAMLPILHGSQEQAIAVYPTNELLRDQVRSIRVLAEQEGIPVAVRDADNEDAKQYSAHRILTPFGRDELQAWRKKLGCRTNGEVLVELLRLSHPNIILTNPDILFLIFALRYRTEAFASLQGYSTLVMDEFHLYSGVELAHMLMLAFLGRKVGMFRKLVFLSATPDPEVSHLLQRLYAPEMIAIGATSARPPVGRVEAVSRVRVHPVPVGDDPVEAAMEQLRDRKDQIRATSAEGRLPALVILNSVVNAIRLEDRLPELGFSSEEIAVIRGLSHRSIRRTQGKLVAVGTAAVEVGVDFHCDTLIFEAGDAASFMQRFGRVGRHGPGEAVVLCPPNVLTGMSRLQGDISRAAFEARVQEWYPHRSAYAWFPATYGGLVTTRALIESLLSRVETSRGGNTGEAAQIRVAFEQFWEEFASQIGARAEDLARVRSQFTPRGLHHRPWLSDYARQATFRVALPSEYVFDYREAKRRGGDQHLGTYSVDVGMLLRRGESIQFEKRRKHPESGDDGLLTVRGYGRAKRVQVIPEVAKSHVIVDRFERTADAEAPVTFLQDNHKVPVSHVMQHDHHMYTRAPRSLKSELDWRLPVFDNGDAHVLAFDGAALLLNEIHRRHENAR